MGYQNTRHLICALALAVALLASAVVPGCRGREAGTVEQLSVVTYRYVIDDSNGVVRVVGLVRNTHDELPTPDAEIIATLHSRTGSFKGQNRAFMPGLEPGAEEQFALAINAHGSVETVAIEIVEPGAVSEASEETEEGTASDSEREDESDGS